MRAPHAVTLLVAALWAAHAGAQEAPPLSLTLRHAWVHDDNVLRLPASVDPAAVTGRAGRSDMIRSTGLRLAYDRDFGLQRLGLYGELGLVRYRDRSNYDHDTRDLGLRWSAELTRRWNVRLNASHAQALVSFANQRTGLKNLVSNDRLEGDLGFDIDPRRGVFVGLDTVRRRNELSTLSVLDLRQDGVEAGWRVRPGTGNEWSLVARQVDGSYPNRAAGSLFDNRFTQRSLLARLSLQPTGASTLTGEVGLTRRRNEVASARDFSGVTANLRWNWQATGANAFDVYLRRDVGGTDLIYSSYALTTVAGAAWNWLPTAKLQAQLRAERRTLDFGGGTGLDTDPGIHREDRITSVGASVSWAALRGASLTLDLRRDQRVSSLANFDFTANVASVQASIRF